MITGAFLFCDLFSKKQLSGYCSQLLSLNDSVGSKTLFRVKPYNVSAKQNGFLRTTQIKRFNNRPPVFHKECNVGIVEY
jgi:hypothetical protein